MTPLSLLAGRTVIISLGPCLLCSFPVTVITQTLTLKAPFKTNGV